MRCYPKEDSEIQSHKFKRSTTDVHIEQHMVSTGSRPSIILGAISPIQHGAQEIPRMSRCDD
jgi:hypothetical protein